ncbi:class I SAM-dependent methyltransferase [Nocardioides acrostichi]|uniref:Methyltransferase domain-containing protein n=1 Tax=Nocardioides acrostichi TaxID=2784339 RepID=A0A930V3M6_9ACTN|nr:class I SAM-dependent methyltransferase [Nocardioides acrostichi]MBF4163246.1 methyltransferase domain-containing protein [Nocardioides acrostichi]
MTSTAEPADPARSFGAVAQAYHRGRPGYPLEAAAWLAGEQPSSVLELGAGTGKLTRPLVELGHDVHACDPDEQMLAMLRSELPGVRSSLSSAEEIPAGDRSADVVVVGQGFQWFDLELALPEIARVLRPGGHLAIAWNERDERIPWVRRLGRIIDSAHPADPADLLAATSDLFADAEHTTFRHRQHVDRESLQDLVTSRSGVCTLDRESAEQRRHAAGALFDEYGRGGVDGMLLPYLTRCRRARVLPTTNPVEDPPDAPSDAHDSPMVITTGSIRRIEVELAKAPQAAVDDGLLLIDFR